MCLKNRRFILLLLCSLAYVFVKGQCNATLTMVPPTCNAPGGYILTIPNTSACAGPTPYTLTWFNANGSCGSPTLTSVPGPGTYAVTFTAGCTSAYNVSIQDNSNNFLGGAVAPAGPGDPSSMNFTPISQVSPSCFGNCNGSKTVFWVGASPITVTLVPSVGSPTTYAPVGAFTAQTYTGLCAGTHTFNATDGNGCVFNNFTFTITQPSTLTASNATSQPSCNSGSNGTFSVTPSGGTPNYTVAFSNTTSVVITGSGTAIASSLSAGPISATVTDSKGCTAIITNTIGQPTTLTITSTQTNVTCGGACSGQASVAISGGGGTYSVSWSPGPGTASLITGLCAGNQTATITDNNGCVRTHTLTITQPTSITITPTIANVTCNGGSNGGASVTASGPPGTITFTWVSPGPSVVGTGSAITNVFPGTYTIISSASSDPTCTVTRTIAITQPPAATIAVVSQSVNCINSCNGSATVTPTGGNGAPFTYTWTSPTGPSQNTQVATNLCAGNHTLTVKDASLCASTTVVTIVQPPPFVANITTTSLQCNGVCNGSITSSPTGGAGTYTFVLTSSTATVTSLSGSFTSLCAGNYTLTITDSNSPCGQSFTVNLLQPNAMAPSVSITPVTCATSCNGVLVGSGAGGTPGYTLSWTTPTGVVAGGVLNNVCAGSYTFNFTDSRGCASTPTIVNLTAPSPISLTITPTNANCSSSCNGILSASVTGGTPGYTLFWQNNSFTGNPNINLCAGPVYSLTVTDASGCVKTGTATISAPLPITVTQTATPTSCAASADGSATITASGGTAPYSYQFNTSPVTTNTTGLISGLTAGNHLVTVFDANGCSQAITFSVTSPVALSAAITGIKGSCTSCTGGSTVTPSNGTAPYSFAWTNALNFTVASVAAPSSMCSGNYTVTVTDSKGCTATATVNIPQIVILTAITGGTGIQCFGACTGSAVASPSGGQAPYSYTWSPGAQNTPTATNLCAGVYTVSVGDNNSPSCVSVATVSVAQPPNLSVTGSQTNVTCFNTCNGAISLTVSGGTGGKTFLWTPGGLTTQNVSNLCAGIYTVTVTDANSCPKTLTFNIAPPFPPITGTLNPTNPTNCGTPNNGSICVTAGGGNGTYSYSWTPTGSASNCITGLVAGTYSVRVTSAGCTNTFFTSLSTPAGPSLTLVSSQNVSCFSGSNGAATYSASGIGPFTFTWSPAVSTTSVASALNSGTYIIASTDIGNNCITTKSIVITQPSSITVTSTLSNVRCNGTLCNGSIAVTPSGGTPAYTFSWSPGGTNTGLSTSATSLCAGSYTLRMTDANNCPPSTFTYVINTPPAISISSTVSNVRCNSACNGSAVATATGGTGPISYNWLPVGAFTGSSTATVLNLCPNVYTLVASDNNTCTATTTFTITEPPALTSTLASRDESCFNTCNGGATLTASGGTPTYSFAWSGQSVTTATIGSLCAGNYTGTVIDGNGCLSATGFTITGPPPFTASLTAAHPKCNSACNGSINTTLSGAQGSVTFSWSPMGSGQNPVNLCAGNYTLLATDANLCMALSVITLTNPPTILANVNFTNPTCNGGCNGTAISTPSNVTASVQYTWMPSGANSATVTSLCSGMYTVILADANQCQLTQTFALTDPPTLSVNPSFGPATCGSANGSITAVAIGGTPGYTFAWNSPSPPPITTTGSVVTNVAAGIYTVTVTDANNCTNSVSIALSNSNGPTAPVTATNNNCNAQCLGTASVGTVSSPIGTLPPVWFIPAPSTTVNPITNLCAGNYSVQLEDVNGCKTFTGVTVSQPPPISIFPNVALPTCNGVCNGSITVNTSGGVSPYTYSWTPGTSASSVLTNACSGDYTVLVGYNSGSCTSTHTFNIPAQFSITIAPPTVVPNNCFGDCAGAATVNVLTTTNGQPTATLSWSNGQSGNTASSLCNGTYSVLVTDSQGCNNSFSVPITSPPQLTVAAAVVQPSCNLCNGETTVTAGGGSGSGYSFNWTTGSSASSLTGLCAGVYQVLIKDGANCQRLQNVIINNSNGINGDTVIVQDENCSGTCNGSATVTATGGNAPLTYSWINPVVPGAAATATGLCAGAYFVQITDADGCVRSTSLNVSAATQLTLTPFVNQPSCSPGNDGSISVRVSGGLAPYTYSWLPAAPGTSLISNLAPGNYTLTVTDQGGAGCSKTQVFSLGNLNGPVVISAQTNISCSTTCNGEITLTVTGTAPVINWSVPGSGNTATVSNLCRGLVTVTVTDNGCVTTRSFSITADPALELNTPVVPITCNNSCNGLITLLPLGGTLPYTFSWQPAAGNNYQLDSLCAGTFTGSVTDSKGCARDTVITLANPAVIGSTVNATNSSCSSISDGALSIQLSGGTAPFTYTWTGPGNFSANTQSISNIFAGTYTLSIADSVGCRKDSIINLVTTLGILADAGADTIVCPGSQAVISGTNSQGALTYKWFLLPDTLLLVASSSTFVLPPASQNYTYQLVVSTSVSSCFDIDTVVVSSYSAPYLDAGPSYTIPVFTSVTIGGDPTSLGAGSVTWTPAEYLSDPSLSNPVASNTIDVTYTVSMVFGKGCIVSDTMHVLLYPEIKLTSGFSPNNDGKNDKWIIDYIEQFPDNTVEIYNRWGELLFRSQGYKEPFDGTYHGKNLPVGTYYYVIHLNHPSYLKPYTGPLTIFR